jgi:hypothetical protein
VVTLKAVVGLKKAMEDRFDSMTGRAYVAQEAAAKQAKDNAHDVRAGLRAHLDRGLAEVKQTLQEQLVEELVGLEARMAAEETNRRQWAEALGKRLVETQNEDSRTLWKTL